MRRASYAVSRGWACAFMLAACSPRTTRPPFAPLPEALRAVINAPPATVAQTAARLLAADSIPVRFVHERDAWLETKDFSGTYRVRLWADPDVPGKARVTIEAVYRPIEDPSRTARDLELTAPTGSPGQLQAARLLAALREELGVTTY
ncbi:MAG TPA: hypothetical protein VJ755_05680 [Gemmatimonadales bacterium]|nr:hypothetical protein [Gemmatimonadales bacterium]